RKPQEIIGEPRSNATAGGRMPPVLDVPHRELASGGAKYMAASLVFCPVHQRHYVLKLVTEPVCSAGLIEGWPSPDAGGQHLVQQPPVQEEVHGPVRGFDLDSRQDFVPALIHFLQGHINLALVPIPLNEPSCGTDVARLPEQKNDLL